MSLYSYMFACLCPYTGPGSYEGPSFWKDTRASCMTCTKLIVGIEGVFCANCSSRRGGLSPCLKAWCEECYDVPSTSPFPIRTAEDDEGYNQTLKGEEKRFRVGRNEDHLMCPFQCDLCHFCNIQRRDLGSGNRKDILLLQCIRRASLDAFWSRESSTVRANARGARRLEEIGDTSGMRSVCPPHGPLFGR